MSPGALNSSSILPKTACILLSLLLTLLLHLLIGGGLMGNVMNYMIQLLSNVGVSAVKRPGKRWLWLIPCVLALAVGLFLLLRSRAASLSAPAPSAALLQASDGLDEIELQAEFLPESRSLRVIQRMALTFPGR